MIQKRNVIMQGSSGSFMDQVIFRTRAGKTILSAPPLIDKNRVPSEKQVAIIERFKQCIRYARAAIRNIAVKAGYAAKAEAGQRAYNVAFADSFNGPLVVEINKDSYTGQAGNELRINAVDNFKVTQVKVSIHSAAGTLVEEGDAVPDAEGLYWLYTVTAANPVVAGSMITATAVDLPGNEGSLEITL